MALKPSSLFFSRHVDLCLRSNEHFSYSCPPPTLEFSQVPWRSFHLMLSCVIFNSQALDWCPFQRNILASGGGTADRHIRFWNVGSGNCLSSIDTHSQVNY